MRIRLILLFQTLVAICLAPDFAKSAAGTGAKRPVSYTHLDVYKRQFLEFRWKNSCPRGFRGTRLSLT